MVNQQPEALRLSELLDSGLQLSAVHHTDAAAELRRLHAENAAIKEQRDELLEALQDMVVKACNWHPSHLEKSCAAIAKATGETK